MNMPQIEQVRIEGLDEKEDLELLVRGDAVAIVFVDAYGEEEESVGAYHGRTRVNQFQFVIPKFSREEYILQHRARKSQIQVRDRKIILYEDMSVTETFSQGNSRYKDLNDTLVKAKLR